MHESAERENATWLDLKQLAWGLLCILPFILVFAYGARVIVGPRAALWLGVGIAAAAIVAIGSVVVTSLLVSYGHDAFDRFAQRRDRQRMPNDRR
jgi:small-conductance mechanosensitive channel